jgi:hypothetical protein
MPGPDPGRARGWGLFDRPEARVIHLHAEAGLDPAGKVVEETAVPSGRCSGVPPAYTV